MFYQMLRHRLNAANHSAFVVPLFKSSFHLAFTPQPSYAPMTRLSSDVTGLVVLAYGRVWGAVFGERDGQTIFLPSRPNL